MKETNGQTEIELLQEISSKLSELTALIGISNKDRDDQIRYLVNFGFSNSDISRIIGIPKGTVDSIRAGFKKKKK
jgi:hypothetical protein